MLRCTKLVQRSAVVIQSNLMAQVQFDVFWDQTTARGGWTVFQKRLDGSVDFCRGWSDYNLGFGNLNGEFWLGLDKTNRLTKSGRYRLRVDLKGTTGKTAYAEFDHFAVSSERTKYQLSLGTFNGEHSTGGCIKNLVLVAWRKAIF